MTTRKILASLVAGSCLISQASAQQPLIAKPKAPAVVRPYMGAAVPPARLLNTELIHRLIRAGKLYLTVQDAIACAIENSLDLEVDRYGPIAADWELERQHAGGPLRGVTSGSTVVNQASAGQGVLGSQQSAGLGGGGGGGRGSSGGAVVSQIGPITPNLDAVFQNTSLYSHRTIPQPNTVQSQTPALVQTSHIFNSVVQQGFLSGGYVQVAANEQYLYENAPSDVLNPSVAPVVQIYLRHNLLQGFGVDVNRRFIRVAERNVSLAQETFRSQLLNVVAGVLNLYWDLVADNDDLVARRLTLEVAQKFYDETKREIELGGAAKVDIYRAAEELETRKRELAISQATVRQQENLLKNALSRNGLADPLVDAVEVVPLDRIEVPEQEDLPPLRELVSTALENRPDFAMTKISRENGEISALGTQSGLMPILQNITSVSAGGLSGKATPQPPGEAADPYYVGGLGNALGQVFRFNFPNRRSAVLFETLVHNRVAQADYGIDQLQLRQNDLIAHRTMNQLVVDISNQVIALRQARARYTTAVDTRALQQQLLEKEQRKFSLGASKRSDVIAVQRSLAAARAAEVASLATYSHARVSLDQVLGQTLEKNHVSVGEALDGHMARIPRPGDSTAASGN
ncbi:MAG TPA: TolC family protein [Bryobacteraceae bacterium]|nr:TolC family protein [Bryobacteraceae bacterium]